MTKQTKTLKKIVSSAALLGTTVISLLPVAAHAAPDCTKYKVNSLGYLLCNFNGADSSKGLGSINSFISEITNIALYFAGILAVLFILYGAFLYVFSYGDDAKIETAKKTIFWAIIGLIVLSLAFIIINLIQKQLQ